MGRRPLRDSVLALRWHIRESTQSYHENPDKIREFAAGRFGRYAGFAQQLIFAAIRKNLI